MSDRKAPNPVARRRIYTLHGQPETDPGEHVHAWCPGCDDLHVFTTKRAQGDPPTRPTWEWDGNLGAPTFTPSLKVTYRHPEGHSNDNPAPAGYDGPYVEDICHSFLTAGVWNFLADSTHHLAGQKVPMVPLPDWLADE